MLQGSDFDISAHLTTNPAKHIPPRRHHRESSAPNLPHQRLPTAQSHLVNTRQAPRYEPPDEEPLHTPSHSWDPPPAARKPTQGPLLPDCTPEPRSERTTGYHALGQRSLATDGKNVTVTGRSP